MSRGHGPRLGLDDEVGWPQFLRGLPFVGVRPFSRMGHIFDITEWRAGIDPSNDGDNLILRERHVVFEFLDANGGVDMPWRHLSGNDAFANGFGPRTRPFVSDQGHRGHRTGVMALLAFGLENRRD